jgi:hypothetical protein
METMTRSTPAMMVAGALACSIACSQVWGIAELPVGAEAPDVDADGAVDGSDDYFAFAENGAASAEELSAAGCSCVPGAPSGWSGPVALYQGPASIAPPGCTGPYSSRLFSGHGELQPPSSDCTACTCGTPQGGACTVEITWFHTVGNCPGGGCNPAQAITNVGCNALTTVGGGCAGAAVEEYEIDGFSSEPASCAPSQSSPVGAASWGTTAVACAPASALDAAACAPSQVCAPPPGPSFSSLCIQSEGTNACPAGPYAHAHVFYAGYQDTRTCHACQCGALTATCVPGALFFRSDNACANQTPGGYNLNPTAGNCYDLAPSSYYVDYHPTMTLGSSCAPSGGGFAGGEATADGAVTLCCIQ